MEKAGLLCSEVIWWPRRARGVPCDMENGDHEKEGRQSLGLATRTPLCQIPYISCTLDSLSTL